MASTYSAIACPHCSCCAMEDCYYKIGERFIQCYRCGYTYIKIINYWNENTPLFMEKEYKGYGVLLVRKVDGKGVRNFIQRPLSSEEVTENLEAFLEKDTDLEESYFVLFENGVFTTLSGNPPEDYYLSFEEYKNRREGNNQQPEIVVSFN